MAATQTVTGTMSVANTVNDQISGGNYLSSNSPAKPARQLSDPNHNCLQELKDALLPKMIEVDQTVTSEKATDNSNSIVSNGKSIANGTTETSKKCDSRKLFKAQSFNELLEEEDFLILMFHHFSVPARSLLTLVCKQWRTILNQPCFWRSVAPILHKRDLYEDGIDGNQKNIEGYITAALNSYRRWVGSHARTLGAVSSLELSGCNDFTEAGLWASLQPRLVSLSISDCINVADESVAAIAQRLPNLQELNFQAYHVTDGVLGCLVALRGGSLSVLRLKSCWELTNQAVVNLVHCLPQLTTLSLSGCSKITDEGVEMIAANMGKLVSLDLSWCPESLMQLWSTWRVISRSWRN
ncbi:putative F-box/LRR-repeat protein 16 isoform X2 [Apostichopus japonicus]|uniref:Putative F-box/LRR-repeat protein 16 isoform X2 n=1 Tax=Stichopus japonicus TaxID=307972 RepID=A0A2G8KCS0_STIJA|nr:putative F-box/LRR-repeat protein 16 isoform X2 [Apostichopus japonicus]